MMTQPQLNLQLSDALMAEALRYLGYRGASVVDDITRKSLEGAFTRLIAEAKPKYTYHLCDKFETKAPSQLTIERFKIQSLALHNHLAPYSHVVLMAATLGTAVDKLIDREMLLSPSSGLLLNAAASALIEEVCDFAEAEALDAIAQRFEVRRENLTTCFRFSPGYGDLDLAVNASIISALAADKRIGVTTSKNHLLVPRKSVTAIFALKVEDVVEDEYAKATHFSDKHLAENLAATLSIPSGEPIANMGCKRGNCSTCTLKDSCPYR